MKFSFGNKEIRPPQAKEMKEVAPPFERKGLSLKVAEALATMEQSSLNADLTHFEIGGKVGKVEDVMERVLAKREYELSLVKKLLDGANEQLKTSPSSHEAYERVQAFSILYDVLRKGQETTLMFADLLSRGEEDMVNQLQKYLDQSIRELRQGAVAANDPKINSDERYSVKAA